MTRSPTAVAVVLVDSFVCHQARRFVLAPRAPDRTAAFVLEPGLPKPDSPSMTTPVQLRRHQLTQCAIAKLCRQDLAITGLSRAHPP